MGKTLKESYKVLGLDASAIKGIKQETCFSIFTFQLRDRCTYVLRSAVFYIHSYAFVACQSIAFVHFETMFLS